RYEVDFAPTLALLGAVGAVELADGIASVRRRRGFVALCIALAAWSVGTNVLLSLQHNRLFEANSPALYARVARAFNYIPYWIARATGHRDGPVELRLVFPTHPRAQIEPLVVTGHEFLSDYLFVHYLGDGVLRFALEHTSRRTWIG